MTWVVALVVGLLLGWVIGAFQGAIGVRGRGVLHRDAGRLPRLARCRMVARERADDRADGLDLQAPGRRVPRHLGGGHGSSDRREFACIAIVALQVQKRRQRARYGFHLRPDRAEEVVGILACGAVLGGSRS